jgi:ubiquinone/menaquinone biosynthesis C-methylase UbiE
LFDNTNNTNLSDFNTIYFNKKMSEYHIERPNNAEEWEREYLSIAEPIKGLNHPVAHVMADLTYEGDILLEAGCGSGEISAELAYIGRRIELADFSSKILDRAAEVFRLSGLSKPNLTCCDLTISPWPWPDNAVDIVWSSGVLEHWSDEELIPIVSEMSRISRRKVISFVPHATSIFYRVGKDYAERTGTWPYGQEIPRHSLQHVFEAAGLLDIQEWDILSEHSLVFLDMIDPKFREAASNWWNNLASDDPARIGQGYLLVTVGNINTETIK